jgi:hypothetical protein
VSVTREAMAAALSSVEGLTGSAHRPATVGAGAAWPVWRSTGLEQGGSARVVRWYVLACLSGDEATAAIAADVLLEPMIAVLQPLGLVIELAEPVRLPLEPGQAGIPALRVAVADHVWVGRGSPVVEVTSHPRIVPPAEIRG